MGKSEQAFRTISEAAAELQLPQHVLRFWETRFPQIKPLKRGGGRRYYRPEDVSLLKGIRHLLYDQGFTIKGVQRILKDKGPRHAIAIGEGANVPDLSGNAGVTASPALEAGGQGNPAVSAAIRKSRLSEKGQRHLSRVMRELLECKRQLDRAREE